MNNLIITYIHSGSSPIEILILWITSAQLVLAAFATVWPFFVKCTTWGKVMALYSSSLDKVSTSPTLSLFQKTRPFYV